MFNLGQFRGSFSDITDSNGQSEPKYYKGLTYVEASEKSGISRQVISKICNKTNKYP